jgi:hypothetical protein
MAPAFFFCNRSIFETSSILRCISQQESFALSLDGKTEQYYNRLNNKSDKKRGLRRRKPTGVGCGLYGEGVAL